MSPEGAAEILPATLVWDIGIGEPDGPSPMVETILPATFEGKPVWRVVHRDLDPTADGAHNAYDLVDVERTTLAPLRSIMDREGFRLALRFDGDRVMIEKDEGGEHQRTEVRVDHPRPEGPGEQVMLASLPLRAGYTTRFPIVDRWAKDEVNRVVEVDLSVVGARRLSTRTGLQAVYEVTLVPRNAAFQIREWVRVASPHYAVRTEYARGELHLLSEVTRLLLDDRRGP
jgi:hypothetical protein